MVLRVGLLASLFCFLAVVLFAEFGEAGSGAAFWAFTGTAVVFLFFTVLYAIFDERGA